jgi:ligand-binding sensor domain-containing protein
VRSVAPCRIGFLAGVAIVINCSPLCHAERYSFKHYTQDSGLTNLAVNTINQDKDGFLWVATDNGLFRYNGGRFERFGRENGLQQDDITALAVTPAGTVWAGSAGGIDYLSGGRFHPALFGRGQQIRPGVSSQVRTMLFMSAPNTACLSSPYETEALPFGSTQRKRRPA